MESPKDTRDEEVTLRPFSDRELPTLTDNTKTLAQKLENINQKLVKDQDLKFDAAAIAKSQMTPNEEEWWTAFLEGHYKLPPLDWEHDRGEPTTAKRGSQRAKRHAEALNRVYNVTVADASHVAWIHANHFYMLPLLKAMARVIGVERQHASQGPHAQTVNRIISVSARVVQSRAGSGVQRREVNDKMRSLIEYRRRSRVGQVVRK